LDHPVLEPLARNFGLLIAYIIPGFIALLGLSLVSEPIRLWLLGAGASGPSIGGVVYLMLACVAAGMTASAVRWALVDAIHHRCGLVRPVWDDARLMERLDAYLTLIEIHYRYYQFYSNSLVALLFSFGIKCRRDGIACGWLEGGVLFVSVVFYAASRDALSRYYHRSALLLGITKGLGTDMTNGGHHDTTGGEKLETKTGETKPTPAPGNPGTVRSESSARLPEKTLRPK
jgi:hypothetical protein